jgi:hypothetical protein
MAAVTIYKANGDVLLTYTDANQLEMEAGTLKFYSKMGFHGPGKQQIRTNLPFIVVEEVRDQD